MKTVKYRCNKCGYSEKIRIRDYILPSIIYIFAMVGLFATVFVFISVRTDDTTITSFLGEFTIAQNVADMSREYDKPLREYALTVANVCEGDYVECYAKFMYRNLSKIKYRPCSKNQLLYSPQDVLEYGGDCKNTAMLYSAMLRSVGFDSDVKCDVERFGHCISKVPLKDSGEGSYTHYILVDLSNQIYKIFPAEKDIWNAFNETIMS